MSQAAQILMFKKKEMTHGGTFPHMQTMQFLEFNDELTILPLHGNKRRMKLNRTLYKFTAGSEFIKSEIGIKRELPALESDKGLNINFELTTFRCSLTNQEMKGFCAYSSNPFRLNGQWVMRAVLKRGDILDFALTRFICGEIESSVQATEISDHVAQSNLPILIEGETGTGKTTLARKIHEQSGVKGRFVHLNLSAFSSSLVESELFGHVKGAFTGAMKDKAGAFVEAKSGTLFLDEIDSLSNELQTKLLLFLDSSEVRPVGGSYSQKVNTRVIAASGKNLLSLVESGNMRRDFYHRLASGVKHKMKPLRENPEKLEELIVKFGASTQRSICSELIKAYKKMVWPGNIRELIGHLSKKHVMTPNGLLKWDKYDDELILPHDFVLKIESGELPTMKAMKNAYVQSVLARTNHHHASAAKVLGVAVNTVRKIDQAARIEEI